MPFMQRIIKKFCLLLEFSFFESLYLQTIKPNKQMRKSLLMLTLAMGLVLSSYAQKVITGKVTDESGKPLSNVSVVVKGTQVGTSTDANGNYKITVPADAKTLSFSSVELATKDVAISGTSVNVKMASKVDQMAEVIVTVPYGSVKKKSFTGAENTVTAATLQKQQVTSVTKALEGLIPGLIATNGGGQPGSGAAVRIRGIGSINANSSPLYVLNGVPYDGSISAIASEDIESVTVLKDAAAAALYGARAANGVIMITTKKGKRGKPVVAVNLRQGIMSRGIPEYDRVDTKEYYELFWEAYRNNYIAQGQNSINAGINASNDLTGPNGLVYNCYNVSGNQLVDPVSGKLNPSAQLLWKDSWEDELFRSANRTNANFSVSGANEFTDYFMSAGYLNEEGIMRNSGFKRYNFRLNLNANVNKWFTTGLNMDGAATRSNFATSGGTAGSNPFFFSRSIGPIYPVYQRDPITGDFVFVNGQKVFDFGTPEQMGTRPYLSRSNPRGTIELDQQYSDLLSGNLNTFGEIRFLKDFTFRATLGLNVSDQYSTDYQNPFFGDAAPSGPGAGDGGRSTKSFFKQLSLTANQVVSWSKVLNKDHNVKLLAGHENYKYKSNDMSGNSAGFLFLGQTELDNGSGPFSNPSSSEDNHRIESYFANANYDYQGKYLLSASFRTDGSSRFRDAVRWGNFYSVGAGWRIIEEEFMKNVKVFDDLKLRVSYGEQGNEDIGLFYPYRDYYFANGAGGYSPSTRIANPNLLWEKNRVTNVGVDFLLLNKRLSGTFEWFNRISDNLLFDVPLPPSTGYSSIYRNIGAMKNYGVELQLGYNAIMKKDFNWRVDVNLTSFKNKITKLPPGQDKTGIISGTKKLMVGSSIFEFWLPQYAGVDASTGDALYYVDEKDANGNVTGRNVTNQYTRATFYFHGTSIPKISGGITNSFNYKGFDLSFLITFAYGGLFYDGNYAGLMHRGDNVGAAWSVDINQRWQKPGDITTVPRLQNTIAGQDGASSRFLVDGSFMNFKNITLSYTLPGTLLNKYNVSNLALFLNVDNAFLLTAKKGMDPQRSFGGTSDQVFTPFRTVTAGLTVNLK